MFVKKKENKCLSSRVAASDQVLLVSKV